MSTSRHAVKLPVKRPRRALQAAASRIAVFSDNTGMGRYDYQYDHASEPMEHDPEQTIEHAMGDFIIAFEELDDAIAGAISGILNRGDEVGRIATAQLSFRNKVDMFGALIKFDRPDSVIATLIDGLCAGLLSVETVRNEIVHSKWRQDFTAGIQRSKFTARVKHGLKETKETWHPGHSAAEARALSTTRNAGVGYVSA